MRRQSVFVSGLILWATACLSAEKPDLKAILGRPIIDRNLPMQEVQAYTEKRVVPMPNVTSAAQWQKHADRLRQQVFDKVVFRGAAAGWRDARLRIHWQGEIAGGPGYKIKKLRFEAVPGLWIPALLYEPLELAGKVPVVMNVNGHDGNGKAAVYKQIRCINQAKRGMLALNVEWLGMGQLRADGYAHYRMNQLDLCGTSGLAPFYLSMKRGLDVLLEHPHADAGRVAVAGLSGGGWQTIFISGLDTRVTLSDPVAGYSSFRTRARYLSDLGDSEQTPNDLGSVADYTHLTAMRAPQPTLLTFNHADDCCFAADHALPPLLDAARPIFALFGKETNLRWHVNYVPGNHNFDRDNRTALYRMMADSFYPNDGSFDPNEIACDNEVKKAEVLSVELPAKNHDFHTLALELSKDLPRNSQIPVEAAPLAAWQKDRREALAKVTSFKQYQVKAETAASEQAGEIKVTWWKLRMGNEWTVPAVELNPAGASETVLVLADGGRGAATTRVEKLLADKNRVIALDPFYLGESRIAQRDYLFALLVATVGDRPLGLQAAQTAAAARWLATNGKAPTVLAVGPRTSLIALVAAGLEPSAIAGCELVDCYPTLKVIIEQNGSVTQTPELFCFGLLEQFDIPQLAALAAPRPVKR